jgi:hypothetical protein
MAKRSSFVAGGSQQPAGSLRFLIIMKRKYAKP